LTPATPMPPVRTPRDGLFGVVLFVVALVPRLYVALAWGGEPVWDGHYYDFGARRIAEGHGYSDDLSVAGHLVWHPWCHYPVGYSGFLAAFYRVFGSGQHVAAVVDACTGAALAVVTWLVARYGLSLWRARIAGLLVAVHPGLILYSALVMTEPLAALLTLAAFWLAVHDTKAMRGAALGAIVLGLAALVRPQALLCAPFLGFVAMRGAGDTFRRWNVPRTVGAMIVLSLLALAPVLPWTARNCRVMDGCALVSTNAGWNLAIGSFPRATGRFETLHASDGCREVTGQVQQDRCWFSYGVAQIKASPSHWLKLIPAKLGFTFDHESFAVEYLREARPADWPEDRRLRVRALTTFAHRLLVFVAALGCVALRARGGGAVVQGALLAGICLLAYAGYAADMPTFWPLAVVASVLPWLPVAGAPAWPWALRLPVVLLGTTLLTHAVFFGEDRYHVVVTPVLCMLAAGALRRPFEA
jgi:4-amino-4-deoxy-L-arabinose transferase-like glycosyltransferase